MGEIQRSDYLMEFKLKQLDPELHRKYVNNVAVMSIALDKYTSNFPTYTDHSMRHSLNVLEFCDKIIGSDNIKLLTADEIYILLMAIYLHDLGMGISQKDYDEMMPRLDEEAMHAANRDGRQSALIRNYHHELSGRMIAKYASLFEIEGQDYIWAIAQVARGHRVTDLMDEAEYPIEYRLDNGGRACLPYLAALIRLADEIDIARDRNLAKAYIIRDDYTEKDKAEFGKANTIIKVEVEGEQFLVSLDATSQYYQAVLDDAAKIRATLEDCRAAVNGRTRYTIHQSEIIYRDYEG